ncbi:MAG: DUF4011 domain-containing protein [Caldilineaceae bacterium]|nr:DUF4011 domain-containing protein [Caldilineaceae bacterium]
MAELQGSLEGARKELLDLSGRNRLTNYRRPTDRQGGIEIIDERPEEVYRTLVVQAKTMTFLATTEYIDGQPRLLLTAPDDFAPTTLDSTFVPERHTDSKLQTALPKDGLDRRLKRSYTKARTFIEEQGVNALFLAMGLLNWYEAETSQEKREAPLILAPVELVRDNVRSRYKLRYTGDEIGFNISLQEKLLREFAIHLPTWPEDEELDVLAYFDMVAAAVAPQRRWSVESSALFVDFYRFSKLHMYQDLDASMWDGVVELQKHPVLPKLFGTHSFIDEALEAQRDYASHALNGQLPPEPAVSHAVTDADSSQERAIRAAMSGKNIIIQGPPGTGKSQTITNLIAEAIGTGKTVLFVAEKMAALQVVKRRLDGLGLGDACLELHSDKSNKKSFLAELERTLQLGEPHVAGQEHNVRILEQERAHLDEYCVAVNSVILETELTPFQAYGAYLKAERSLAEAAPPPLSIPDSNTWAESDFLVRLESVRRLQTLLKSIGRPTEHPFWGSQRQRFLPADQQTLVDGSLAAERSVGELRKSTEQAAVLFGLPLVEARIFAATCLELINQALAAPAMQGLTVNASEWKAQIQSVLTAIELGELCEQNRQVYEQYLIPQAVEESLTDVRKAIVTHGDRMSRYWSRDYRRALKLLKSVSRGELPSSKNEQLRLVDATLEVQRLTPRTDANRPLLRQLFGSYWNELNPAWPKLREIAQWIERVLALNLDNALVEHLFDYVGREPEKDALTELRVALQSALNSHQHALQEVMRFVDLNEQVRLGGGHTCLERPFHEQTTLLHAWALQAARLQEMVSYNTVVTELHDNGLAAVVHAAQEWEYASSRLVDLVRKSRYGSLIERAMHERPILAGFDGVTHGQRVERFRELDKLLLQQQRSVVLHEHWQRLPTYQAGGLGLLYEQFNRKRGHKSIRTLMREAGPTIQAIKPIFMMSPFSIAIFLEAGSVEFDMVVFDEASQVKPVDALGAILRGKQTIVVGDDKQLPPTNFFDRVLDEEDNDSIMADTESILGLFRAKAARQEMLEWHYRSRHESLIAVSNYEFYNNRLMVFPSPDNERARLGLLFHHLPQTRYTRRTDGSGGGYNGEEALAVAEAVMNHARSQPDKSLLVAAFNQQQREAIDNLVDKLRQSDSTGEQFFSGHPTEPFAVKNLENVQGDERDVILISIGFGRDQDNKISMNFGPLNKDGGERRLNVLITRARERCEVFSNITDEDIDLSRTQARGVRALKRFLKYARTGILDLPEITAGEAESPFEHEVATALRAAGFQIALQVGTGGYRIDMAIVDEARPGRYLLGIECDGATYHRTKTARDRDRLRQEVLEAMGWEIHRIWSTDWFRHPQREIQRIQERVEKIRAKWDAAELAETDTSASELPINEHPVIVRDENTHAQDRQLPKYVVAEPQFTINSDNCGDISVSVLTKELVRIAQIEAPIHVDQLFQRVFTRVTKVVRAHLEKVLNRIVNEGKLVRDGEYLLMPGTSAVVARDRGELPVQIKKIQHIYPQELKAAVMLVVTRTHGIMRSDLGREALKLIGYARVTDNMDTIVEDVIREMLAQGEVHLRGEQVVE